MALGIFSKKSALDFNTRGLMKNIIILFAIFAILCIPVCSFEYTYSYEYDKTNHTYTLLESGSYAGQNVAWLPGQERNFFEDTRYYEYNEFNESYITLLVAGDILQDQYNYYQEIRYNDSYIGKYDNSVYLDENETLSYIEKCDNVRTIGSDLLNETISIFVQGDYEKTILTYDKFIRVNVALPAILERNYVANHVLSEIRRNSNTYIKDIDRRREQKYENMLYDEDYLDYGELETKARQYMEYAANSIITQENEAIYKESFTKTGIEITTSQYYDSHLVKVPINDYELEFHTRDPGKMYISNNFIQHEVGSGTKYHVENFNETIFRMDENFVVAIAEYVGSSKYKPENPYDTFDIIDAYRNSYTTKSLDSINIDGHKATGHVGINSKHPEKTKKYCYTYKLDSNTYVKIFFTMLDYQKEVSLILETIHIKKG